jgi:hypothetical protein
MNRPSPKRDAVLVFLNAKGDLVWLKAKPLLAEHGISVNEKYYLTIRREWRMAKGGDKPDKPDRLTAALPKSKKPNKKGSWKSAAKVSPKAVGSTDEDKAILTAIPLARNLIDMLGGPNAKKLIEALS